MYPETCVVPSVGQVTMVHLLKMLNERVACHIEETGPTGQETTARMYVVKKKNRKK